MTSLKVHGTVRVPGDKSISHRALILASMARGSSRIEHILESADVQSTADCLRALGASVPVLSSNMYVHGAQFHSPRQALDCGNSGTTARLLAGVVAGAGIKAVFEGDASLTRRPMRRVAEPLRAMGARVDFAGHGGLPMTIDATGVKLLGVDYESTIASAQVKSALLLAAVIAGVRARVSEPHMSRDHTERMLAARGVEIQRNGTRVYLPPAQRVRPQDVRVPADPSSAAFFVALALLADAGELRLADVCLNGTRTGFFDALQRMGAHIQVENKREEGGETIGTLVARPAKLKGIEIDAAHVPAMIDELPLLACVATRVDGEVVVSGAGELRVKESDRIATIVSNLNTLGAEAEEKPDGFRVVGAGSSPAPLRGRVETLGDHRIAMSFGILGALPGNDIEVDDAACVGVSYPNFWKELERVRQ
jgi:3-phosphoshikimate 1-carboxyvinyltransferase